MTNVNHFLLALICVFFCAPLDAQNRLGEKLRERMEERRGERAQPNASEAAVELSYGDHQLQKLDFWKADKPGAALVIFVHGGGWKRGDKATSVGVKDQHYLQQGYAFASVNYRLVPDHAVEDQAADVAAAIAHLVERSGELGFDKSRVVLMGHSAGAHLVALVGTDPKWLKNAGLSQTALSGVIPIDGAAYHVANQIGRAGRLMKDTYLEAFGTDAERRASLSPTLQAAAPNAPAFLLLHVEREDAKTQSNALAAALKEAGTAVEVRDFPGKGLQGHAEINKRMGDPSYPATAVVDKWIEDLFSQGTSSAQKNDRNRQVNATGVRYTFSHQDSERAYRIHIPNRVADSKTPVPLVFCFHGGGGTAEVASKMGWTPKADQEGFIVVYPEGLNKHWGDGRDSPKFAEQEAKVDDVAFVLALLEKLKSDHPVDPAKVFVTGASNGGFFSQRLVIEAADRFAAAGVVIATMPAPYTNGKRTFDPVRPVRILYMNGTEDPFVPYTGGPVTPNFFPKIKKRDFNRGECSSTDVAIQKWIVHNGLEQVEPVTEKLADTAPGDGCTVEKTVWKSADKKGSVVLYKVIGGGHTLPGGVQYLPERIIGKTCQDFDAVDTIWAFFEAGAE